MNLPAHYFTTGPSAQQQNFPCCKGPQTDAEKIVLSAHIVLLVLYTSNLLTTVPTSYYIRILPVLFIENKFEVMMPGSLVKLLLKKFSGSENHQRGPPIKWYMIHYKAKKVWNGITPDKLEGFERPKQAQMKGNVVEMVQSSIRIDVVGGIYYKLEVNGTRV